MGLCAPHHLDSSLTNNIPLFVVYRVFSNGLLVHGILGECASGLAKVQWTTFDSLVEIQLQIIIWCPFCKQKVCNASDYINYSYRRLTYRAFFQFLCLICRELYGMGRF